MSFTFSLFMLMAGGFDEYRSANPNIPAAIMVREYEDGKVEVFHLDKLPEGDVKVKASDAKATFTKGAEYGEYMESVGANWGFYPASYGNYNNYMVNRPYNVNPYQYNPGQYWNSQSFFYNHNGWQYNYAYQYRVVRQPTRVYLVPCVEVYFY